MLGAIMAPIVGCADAPPERPAQGTTGIGGGIIIGVGGGGGSSMTGGGSGIITGVGGGGGTSGSDSGNSITGPLPADFIKTEAGGYKLGPAIMGQGATDTGLEGKTECNIIVGVVRDFKGSDEAGGHPDFERFSGGSVTSELVAPELGSDGKPIYTSKCEVPNPPVLSLCPYGQQTTGRTNFDQWYRFTPGVNHAYLLYFMFQTQPGSAVVTFSSGSFFPVDGAGWATGTPAGRSNYGFTTELHTKFRYNGGETFQFQGDDDLWVFINARRVIDLGGLHPSQSARIELDAIAATFDLKKGNVYPLELFHAERHTAASNFRLDTTLALVDCGVIPPDVR